MHQEYHVAVTGCDENCGDKASPFRTISKAAAVMEAGDRVIVHEGVYREWVKPARGGKNDACRIIYEAAPGEKVVIKGSEKITGWVKEEGTVWKATVPNTLFGEYNPYAEPLKGDWYLYPDYPLHPGEVYLNGKALYEAASLEEVRHPKIREKGVGPYYPKRTGTIPHPEDTIYQWKAEAGKDETTIYANFHEYNPNEEEVEINVRESCFYPEKRGIDYITVSGFEMTHAATRWAPPSSNQQGLIGPRWSRGWVIQNNIIHDSKCMGISIGRDDLFHGDLESERFRKSGHQHQLELIFEAGSVGWSKEHIGSHVICDNIIYNCGQDGIGGNLGCIFSRISHNRIYHIGTRQEFFGHEIAGIKLYTAIDVEIEGNWISDCTLGTWLDWEAQGVHLHGNVYENNGRDLMIEVTHGPHLIENNVFASKYNLDNVAQGGAYVHNLFCGVICQLPELERVTPYHFAHSTAVKGYAFVYGGDDRFYNNLFVGGERTSSEETFFGAEGEEHTFFGTAGYNDCPRSLPEYLERINQASRGRGNTEAYVQVKQPVYLGGNVYLNGAEHCESENALSLDVDPKVRIIEEEGNAYLEINMPEEAVGFSDGIINTEILGTGRLVEEPFLMPDGKEYRSASDYAGNLREGRISAGPFQQIHAGANKILLWEA